MVSWPISLEEAGSEYDGPFSTYPEAHASLFAIGYAILFYLALLVWPPAALVVALQILRVGYFALTGRRLEIGGTPLGLPTKYLQQIRDEGHYFLPLLGVLLASIGIALHLGTPVDVVGRFVGVIGG